MKIVVFFVMFTLSNCLHAQSHELNMGFGCSYYYGDLSASNAKTSFLNVISEGQNWNSYRPSYSIGYRYNFKSRFSLGLNFYHFNLAGYDSDNPNTSNFSDPSYFRFIRNLSFYTAVNQGYIDFRYEPFRKTSQPIFSPYFSLGLGMFQFNPKTMLNGKEYELQPLGTEGQGLPGHRPKYSLTEFCFPLALGLKFNIPSSNFALALDYSYSITLSDYIDDVSTNYPDIVELRSALGIDQALLVNSLADRNYFGQNSSFSGITSPGEKRGDSRNKDNFITAQFKLIYYFNNTEGNSYYTIYR